MATLSNPTLRITLVSSQPQADVEAMVDVALTKFEKYLIESGLGLTLQCRLWGADSGLTRHDDRLYTFRSQRVPNGESYRFAARVPKDVLDEDFGGDEVYARFQLVSLEPAFPLDVSANSPEVSGRF